MAIGSPEALSHTVTLGIVSAKHRHIHLIHKGKTPGYENYIQTDAAINPGNSGGAMVDMDGELVGINAAIYSSSGMNGGIGFAVPINIARGVMKQIIKTGKATHAQLGIYGNDINPAMAKSFGLKNNQGIIIEDVENNTPAAKAGLQQGDVLKTMDGKSIQSYDDFRTKIATSKPGQKITLGIVRNGKKKKVHVTLGKIQLKSNQTS
jgi:serine protease Do